MAIVFMDGFDIKLDYVAMEKAFKELRTPAEEHKMIVMTGWRWEPKEGDNFVRILPPSESPKGGEALKYEPQITVRVMKNRSDTQVEDYSSQFPGTAGTDIESFAELDDLGNTPEQAAELDELCREHDEWVSANPGSRDMVMETMPGGPLGVEEAIQKQLKTWVMESWVKKVGPSPFRVYQILLQELPSFIGNSLQLHMMDKEIAACLVGPVAPQESIFEGFARFEYTLDEMLAFVDANPTLFALSEDVGYTPGTLEDKIGVSVPPDMAANAAMLREQLRVETNVRLSLSEAKNAQNQPFSEKIPHFTDNFEATFPEHAIIPKTVL